MSFTFQIRPISFERGFELSCEGVLPGSVYHERLIQAIIEAAQLGRDLPGVIEIYDRQGQLAEVLPLHRDHADSMQRAA